MKLWIHQYINILIRSKPSWSSCHSMLGSTDWGTRCSKHAWFQGDTWCPTYNKHYAMQFILIYYHLYARRYYICICSVCGSLSGTGKICKQLNNSSHPWKTNLSIWGKKRRLLGPTSECWAWQLSSFPQKACDFHHARRCTQVNKVSECYHISCCVGLYFCLFEAGSQCVVKTDLQLVILQHQLPKF